MSKNPLYTNEIATAHQFVIEYNTDIKLQNYKIFYTIWQDSKRISNLKEIFIFLIFNENFDIIFV